jgi:hypothetical protein
MPVPKAIFEQIAKLIPPLNGTLHKGQAGAMTPDKKSTARFM